ncbi:MAG: hypothetical protein WCP82_05150 [Alphaproteobacteria bacterium]
MFRVHGFVRGLVANFIEKIARGGKNALAGALLLYVSNAQA